MFYNILLVIFFLFNRCGSGEIFEKRGVKWQKHCWESQRRICCLRSWSTRVLRDNDNNIRRRQSVCITSARSFLISVASSSHCWVYCHFAVISLSTTCSKCKCRCSSSSFCNSNLLKLTRKKHKSLRWSTELRQKKKTKRYLPGLFQGVHPSLAGRFRRCPEFVLPHLRVIVRNDETMLREKEENQKTRIKMRFIGRYKWHRWTLRYISYLVFRMDSAADLGRAARKVEPRTVATFQQYHTGRFVTALVVVVKQYVLWKQKAKL